MTLGWQTEYPPNTGRIRKNLMDVGVTLREQMEDGSFGVAFEPGDGTHYEIFGVYRTPKLWYIGFMSGDYGGGSAVLPVDQWQFAGYVQEKLNIENGHSARILTDLLNFLFDHMDLEAHVTEV